MENINNQNDQFLTNYVNSNPVTSPKKPIHYDQRRNITIRHFDDLRPQNKQYFYPLTNKLTEKSSDKSPDKSGLAIIIPFYNEESTAVQQTLNSLYETWNYLRKYSTKWSTKNLYICLVQDGWNRAHPTMKEYIKALFPKKIYSRKIRHQSSNAGVYWWDYYKDFNGLIEEHKEIEQIELEELEEIPDRTFIIQKRNYGPVKINPQESFKNDNKYLNLTLIIKTKNRRKHNSHEWFLGKNGFAEAVNAEYLYLTDAFTLYNETMLYHLVKSLDRNSNMVGVTGRQRVMSKQQQGCEDEEKWYSYARLYRLMQLYDFESSNVIYNGAFSLGGFLPVLPGPSGLYRASNLLNNQVRDYYFDSVNRDPDQTNIIQGNCKNAEDRILSYAAVIKSDNPKAFVQFNTSAVFYFEAETNLDSFIFQRRRWINGSVAGYLHLFSHYKHFKEWKASRIWKVYTAILLFCQLTTYGMMGIAPSVVLRILYHGINYYLKLFDISVNFDIIIIGIFCWSVYFIHVFWHYAKSRYNYIIMQFLLHSSFLATIISISSLLIYAFWEKQKSPIDIILSKNPHVYLTLYVIIGTFLYSLPMALSFHPIFYMLQSVGVFYLSLPMLTAWFSSYAYARLWDLSWGNRPATEMDAVSENKKEEVMRRFKKINLIIIVVLLVTNVVLYVLVPLNVQIWLVTLFFAIAAYQLTLSLIYFIVQIFSYKLPYYIKKCLKQRKQSRSMV